MTPKDIRRLSENCLFFVLFIVGLSISTHHSFLAFGDTGYGVLNFKKILADGEKRYAIGEVQNNDPTGNINSIIYFGNSTGQFSYSYYLGLVGHGMAMPFKIDLSNNKTLNLDQMKVESLPTLAQPVDFLLIDYSTLHMNKTTHAITGILRNTSPSSVSFVKVFAIAMGSHAEVLDVTQSDLINNISSNGTVKFTLVPSASIAKDVRYYSCFVPGQMGENYTLASENGTNMTIQISTDGNVKNVRYNQLTHSIEFDAQGVFPQGGWAEVMVLSQPPSYSKFQSLGVTLNNQSSAQSISSAMTISQNQVKHVSFLFPFGKNTVFVQPTNLMPEFSTMIPVLLIGVLSALLFRKKYYSD